MMRRGVDERQGGWGRTARKTSNRSWTSPAEQHAEECRWHELFSARVGIHTDYEEQERRLPTGYLWPREQWREFYEPYGRRTSADFSPNEVLGWFER